MHLKFTKFAQKNFATVLLLSGILMLIPFTKAQQNIPAVRVDSIFSIPSTLDPTQISQTQFFRIPDGVTSVKIQCWGAGAAGAYMNAPGLGHDPRAGVGGGGGAYACVENLSVTPGQVLTVVIGQGGYGSSNVHSDGGDSYVKVGSETKVLAKGGASVANDERYNVGIGGKASECIGDVRHSGGDGIVIISYDICNADAGTIALDDVGCVTIISNQSEASGTSGTYFWEKSSDGNTWEVIAGASNKDYTPSETAYYHRGYTTICGNALYSNTVYATVVTLPAPGFVSLYGQSEVTTLVACSGSEVNVNLAAASTGASTLSWQFSDDNGANWYYLETLPANQAININISAITTPILHRYYFELVPGCKVYSNNVFTITIDTGVVAHENFYFDTTAVQFVLDYGEYQITPYIATPTFFPTDGVRLSNNKSATENRGQLLGSVEVGTHTIVWTVTDCSSSKDYTIRYIVSYSECEESFTAVDADSNVYSTTRIGSDCWMRENLRSLHYNTGDTITEWYIYASPLHHDTLANLNTYGRLYTWNAAAILNEITDTPIYNIFGHIEGICPSGWVLPTALQYLELESFVSRDLRSTILWMDGLGTDLTHMTMLPAGCYNAESQRFEDLLGSTYFWMDYEATSERSLAFWIDCHCYQVQQIIFNKNNGFSVRCIKEKNAKKPTVHTHPASDVSIASATLNGNVADAGGLIILDRGFCYGTEEMPSMETGTTIQAATAGLGAYSETITGLTRGTRYYVRAYAVNAMGLSYGEQMSFIPREPLDTISFIGNGGLGLMTPQYVYRNVITPLKPNGFYIPLCVFAGWSLEPNTAVVYADRAHISSTGNMSLFAQWFRPVHKSYTVKACDSYTWATPEGNNSTFTESGTYIYSHPDIHGCTQVDTLHLTIYNSVLEEVSESICDIDFPYLWRDTIFEEGTVTGDYVFKRYTENYCDSIVTLHLKVSTCYDTITFMPNGATIGTMEKQIVLRGKDTTLNANIFDHEGNWKFTSWNTEKDGSSILFSYDDEDDIRTYGNVTLYAQWFTWCDGIPDSNETGLLRITSVYDAEYNNYAVVQIGSQCWLKENLRSTHYTNGDSLTVGDTISFKEPYCYYPDNDSTQVETYGYLYNWKAATKDTSSFNTSDIVVQGICPKGWHIPSMAEWNLMKETVNNNIKYRCADSPYVIAQSLASTSHWYENDDSCTVGSNLDVNNKSGFSALPAGIGNYQPYTLGYQASFWSSTQALKNKLFACSFNIENDNGTAIDTSELKSFGLSVRCVRDYSLMIFSDTELDSLNLCGDTATVHYYAYSKHIDPDEYIWKVNGTDSVAQRGPLFTVNYTTSGNYRVSCSVIKDSLVYASIDTLTRILPPSTPYIIPTFVIGTDDIRGTAQVVYKPNVTKVFWLSNDTTLVTTGDTCNRVGDYTVVAYSRTGCTASKNIKIRKVVTSCRMQSTTSRANEFAHYDESKGRWLLDSVADHQGNIYLVVQMGTQCWLRQNMRCTTSPTNKSWTGYSENPQATQYPAYYINTSTSTGCPDYKEKYGVLYNFTAATDQAKERRGDYGSEEGICPQGWHLPTSEEYNQMYKAALSTVPGSPEPNPPFGYPGGYKATNTKIATLLAGGRDWQYNPSRADNTGCDYEDTYRDAVHFSALPGGYMKYSSYQPIAQESRFWAWTSRQSYGLRSPMVFVNFQNTGVGITRIMSERSALSVRCVRYGDCPAKAVITFKPNGGSGSMPQQYLYFDEPTTIQANRFTHSGNWEFIGWGLSENDSVAFLPGASISTDSDITLYAQWHSWCTGYASSNEISNGDNRIDSVKDHQNNSYKVVQIGDQCWLKENMRCSTSPNGILVSGDIFGSDKYKPRYYDYNNTVSAGFPQRVTNWHRRGYLYNWCGAMDSSFTPASLPYSVDFNNRRGICPKGWHLPTSTEWNYMKYNAEIGDAPSGKGAGKIAGGNYWIGHGSNTSPISYSYAQRNTVGLSTLPVGVFNENPIEEYNFSGYRACFHTASTEDNTFVWGQTVEGDLEYVNTGTYSMADGFSIRCVRDSSCKVSVKIYSEMNLDSINMCDGHTFVHYLAVTDNSIPDAYIWKVNGVDSIAQRGPVFTVKYTAEGNYTVSCYLVRNGSIYANTETTTRVLPPSTPHTLPSFVVGTDDIRGTAKVVHKTNVAAVYWFNNNSISHTIGDTCNNVGNYTVVAYSSHGCSVSQDVIIQKVVTFCRLNSSPLLNEFAHYDESQGVYLLDSVADHEGNKYLVVQIDRQCWLRQNMRCTTSPTNISWTEYRNNPDVNKKPAYYIPNHPDYKEKYGVLYNMGAAANRTTCRFNTDDTDRKGICPVGWHLPTFEEYDKMFNATLSMVPGSPDPQPAFEKVSAQRPIYQAINTRIATLMAGGHDWQYNPGRTNNTGCDYEDTYRDAVHFSALPGGYMYKSRYHSISQEFRFWTKTQRPRHVNNSLGRFVNFQESGIGVEGLYNERSALSVRCVRDVPTEVVVHITFKPNGGNGSMTQQNLYSNTPTTIYANEFTHSGNWKFIGWGLNENDSVAFLPGASITIDSNITLYAQWHTWCSGTADTNEFSSATNRIDSVRDHENNSYKVVQIGEQCWLKENVRCSTSPKGLLVSGGTFGSDRYNPRYYDYNAVVPADTAQRVTDWRKRGYLYNWSGAMDSIFTPTSLPDSVDFNNHRGICPKGWHLPTRTEWNSMKHNTEIGDAPSGKGSGKIAGGNFWIGHGSNTSPNSYSYAQRNTSGFSTLPVGVFNGSTIIYCHSGIRACFHTASTKDNSLVWGQDIEDTLEYVNTGKHSTADGFSIRCVRDNSCKTSVTISSEMNLGEIKLCNGHTSVHYRAVTNNYSIPDACIWKVNGVDSIAQRGRDFIVNYTAEGNYIVSCYLVRNDSIYAQADTTTRVQSASTPYIIPSFVIGTDDIHGTAKVVNKTNVAAVYWFDNYSILHATGDKCQRVGDYTVVAYSNHGCSVSKNVKIQKVVTSCRLNSSPKLGEYAHYDISQGIYILDSVADHEGNIYLVVQVGNQCWLRQNMRCKSSPTNKEWIEDRAPREYKKPACYIYHPDHVEKYGILYNMGAAADRTTCRFNTDDTDHKGICPRGWHLPTFEEYDMLFTEALLRVPGPHNPQPPFQKINAQNPTYQATNTKIATLMAGGHDWKYNPGRAGDTGCDYEDPYRDAVHFSALPGGYMYRQGYRSISQEFRFWTRSKRPGAFTANNSLGRFVNFQESGIGVEGLYNERSALSVRCVRDEYAANAIITFMPNGGSGSMTQQSVIPNRTTPIQGNQFIHSNWKFIGWGLNENDSVAFLPGASITIDTNITLYAQWHTWCTGTADTNEFSNAANRIDSVRDHQNNWYKVVQIGEQCWLKENMRCSTSPKGILIFGGTSGSDMNNPRYYDYNTAVQADTTQVVTDWRKRGYLYNWCGAMDSSFTPASLLDSVDFNNHRGICPKGWHIFTSTEWDLLKYYAEIGDAPLGKGAGKIAGGNSWIGLGLSSSPNSYLYSQRNFTGLSVLPVGVFNGDTIPFNLSGVSTGLYSASLYWGSVLIQTIENYSSIVRTSICSSDMGYPVRCVRDKLSPVSGYITSDVKLDSANLCGIGHISVTYTAVTDNFIPDSYIWKVNGADSIAQHGPNFTVNYTAAGNYSVSCYVKKNGEVYVRIDTTTNVLPPSAHYNRPEFVIGTDEVDGSAKVVYSKNAERFYWFNSDSTLVTTETICELEGNYVVVAISRDACTATKNVKIQKVNTACKLSSRPSDSNEYAHYDTLQSRWLLDSIADHEGNKYLVVQIGEQCWMRQNMRCTTSPNPDRFFTIIFGRVLDLGLKHILPTAFVYPIPGSNVEDYVKKYGLLYNMAAASDQNFVLYSTREKTQGICPNGWHLPTFQEYNQMCMAALATVPGSPTPSPRFKQAPSLNYQATNTKIATLLAGGHDWPYDPNNADDTGCDYEDPYRDAVHFSALPAGYRSDGSYNNIGSRAAFWTSTDCRLPVHNTYARFINFSNKGIAKDNYWRLHNAFSVRCVRN